MARAWHWLYQLKQEGRALQLIPGTSHRRVRTHRHGYKRAQPRQARRHGSITCGGQTTMQCVRIYYSSPCSPLRLEAAIPIMAVVCDPETSVVNSSRAVAVACCSCLRAHVPWRGHTQKSNITQRPRAHPHENLTPETPPAAAMAGQLPMYRAALLSPNVWQRFIHSTRKCGK